MTALRKNLIGNLFFITLFVNLTIPKSGIYIHIPEYIRLPITSGYIVFFILFSIWIISNRNDLKEIFLGSFLKKVCLVYLLYSFLRYFSVIFSDYKSIGKAMVFYIVYGGYLLVFYFALDMRRFKEKIIKIIAISMGIICIYGLMQVFFDSEKIAWEGLTEIYGSPEEPLVTYGDGGRFIQEGSASIKNSIHFLDNSGETVFAGRKVFSTFHHGNLFGGHLVLFAPIIVSLLCLARKRKEKALYFCLALIIVLSLLFANSRGAVIGFFISGVTLFLISREKKKVFLILTLVLLVSVMLFSFILAGAQKFNLKITSADPRIYQKKLIQDRYGTIFKAPAIIKKNFISHEKSAEAERRGLEPRLDGITNYRYGQYQKFCSDFLGRRNIKYLAFGRGYRSLHVYQNLYLNLLGYLGVTGFIGFLYIIVYILWKTLKSGVIFDAGNSIESRALAMGGISGIVGFLADNLFDNLIYFPPFGLNFWILNGLVLVVRYKGKNE